MKLHAVQVEAHRRAAGHQGFAYFMQQGLGKTGTALTEFAELVANDEAQRMVVFCPNSFKSGWAEEVEKWNLKFETHIFESGKKSNEQFVNSSFSKPPLLIVNYEAIRSSSTIELIQRFCSQKSAYVAADESVQISTHNSNQTKAAIVLAKEAKWRRILSGKPMKQGPHDYWSQMRFIGLLDGVNYFHFRSKFCELGGFKGKQIIGVKNEEGLARIIAPHSFTALKSEWTDLPPKLYTTREYRMSAEQQRQFNSMMEDFILFVNDEQAVTVDAAITKYLKLAQIQAGFILDEEGGVHELVSNSSNPRLNLLLDILEDEVSGKVIIPYHHKHVFNILYGALQAKGYNPAFIKGGMTPEGVSEQKVRFNEDPNCRVILLQTRASKYGHTLLGGPEPQNRCSTMVFYENTYSLDDRSQIEDRNHRHGQVADNCLYIDLAGTVIDKNMTEALQKKEDLFQMIQRAVRAISSGA
jgi:SNF2 family DNA or RNA helicase